MAGQNQFITHEMSINFSHPKLYQPKDELSLCEFHMAGQNQFNMHEMSINFGIPNIPIIG